jgi:hypothetical protein
VRFWERWQTALAAYGDAGQALGDVVGSIFDEKDDDIGHYASLLGRAAKGVAYGSGNAAMGNVGAFLEPTMEASEYLYSNLVNQPISAYQTAWNLAASPTWQKQQGFSGGLDALTSGDTWAKAWDIAKTTSIGQAGWRGSWVWDGKPIDIMDKDAVANLQDDPLFNVASGLTDAAVGWYGDPLGKVAKVYTAARKVSNTYGAGASVNDPWLEQMLFKHTPLGAKRQDPLSFSVLSPAMDEFQAWARGKSARQIVKHPMIAKSRNPDDFAGVIAGLMDRQDTANLRLTLATAFGSKLAFDTLSRTNKNLAGRIANVREMSNPLLEQELLDRKNFGLFVGYRDKKLESRIDALKPSSENYHENLRSMLVEHDQYQKDIMNAVLGEHEGASGLLYTAVDQVPKMKHTRIADRRIAYDTGDVKEYLNSAVRPQAVQRIIQSQPFGTPIRLITSFPFKVAQGFTNKRPPSWVDPQRGDSSAGVVAYMKHSKVFTPNEVNMFTSDYLEALSTDRRRQLVHQIEATAIERIAQKHGINREHSKLLAMAAQGKRNNVMTQLKGTDGRYFLDDDGNIVRWPLFETQEVNSFPLLDLQEFNRVAGKHRESLIASSYYSATAFIDNAFTAFNGIWSSAQLLRIGYGMRNVTESTLRLSATLGGSWIALAAADGLKAGIGGNLATRGKNIGRRLGFAGKTMARTAALPTPLMTMQKLKDSTLRDVDKLGRDRGSVRTLDSLGFEYHGAQHETQYHGKAGGYKVLAGSSFHNLSGARDDFLKILRKTFNSNEIINPADRGHLEAWAHIANNVIGKSELARKFFEGNDYAQVYRWLTRDPYGQNVLKKVGGEGIHARAIVGESMSVVDNYVPLVNGPNPNILREKALAGELTAKDLEEYFPNQATRPQLWNPVINLNLRQGDAYRALEWLTSRAFKYIAQMPEDKLIRNPAFRQMYVGNIRQLQNNLERQVGQGNLTNLDIQRIDHAAREKSLRQLKALLYDGDTTSNIAHRFRMVMGFMPAWEDSIRKWGRIITENPSALISGGKLWNAPNEMSLGETWDPNAFDEETGKRGAFVPRFQVVREVKDKDGNGTGKFEKSPVNYDIFSWNDDSKIIVRIPKAIADRIPGSRSDEYAQSGPRDDVWTIDKDSMNLILQGDEWWLPSAGPLTQLGVSEIAYAFPTKLTDVYRWAIPFGQVSRNPIKALMPATYKRIYESGESVSDDSYAYIYMNNLQTEITRMRLHERNALPLDQLMKEVEDRTQKQFYLRAFVNFFMPFSAENSSPYQYYIDKYRELRTQYSGMVDANNRPVDVDEMFRQRYGDDFYMFTTSLSKNNTGLPASKRAYELSEQNRDLISKDPEMARIYMSDLDDATFDQYVYGAQFEQEFGIGEIWTAREKRSPAEAIKETNRKLGWAHYTKVNDYLMSLEDQNPDMAEFVDFARARFGEMIAKGNPDFAEDYFKSDPEKVPSRIAKMKQLASDPALQGRSEIRQLVRYLYARDRFIQVLDAQEAAGGPKTLRAKDNDKLADLWKSTQLELARGDTLFGRLYWRFLSNDMLQRSRLET